MFEDYVDDEEHVLAIINGKSQVSNKREPIGELTNLSTDELLDMYNDYDSLHKVFKDDAYKVKMNQIIKVLNKKRL